MHTATECRAHAEEKLAQSGHDDRNRNRLIAAAEAWLFLGSQLRQVEAGRRARNTLKKELRHGGSSRALEREMIRESGSGQPAR
jgi:hypothetical protein